MGGIPLVSQNSKTTSVGDVGLSVCTVWSRIVHCLTLSSSHPARAPGLRPNGHVISEAATFPASSSAIARSTCLPRAFASYAEINAAESLALAAARWFNGLEETVYALTLLPRRCPVAPEGRTAKRPLRHLLYGNKPHVYRAIYEIDESHSVVYVLTIRHGAMDEARPDELL